MAETRKTEQHTVKQCRRDVLIVQCKGWCIGILILAGFSVLFYTYGEGLPATLAMSGMMGWIIGGTYINDHITEALEALERAKREADREVAQ